MWLQVQGNMCPLSKKVYHVYGKEKRIDREDCIGELFLERKKELFLFKQRDITSSVTIKL
jgi:hypothetical protein